MPLGSEEQSAAYWYRVFLLTWPHWSVHRNIPDVAIERLHNLRLYSPCRSVRKAADDALAKILSLETGIEDD